MNSLEDIDNYLHHNIQSHDPITDSFILNDLRSHKELALIINDQETATLIWCYEQILHIQNNYRKAFRLMKLFDFFEAWCLLERIEIASMNVHRHFNFQKDDKYKIDFITDRTKEFQSLYPYKYFISPAFIIKEQRCSICHKSLSIHSFCEHKKGEIYDGEFCVREITDAEFLEMSIVTNPVQKYSVLFMAKDGEKKPEDNYDYAILKHLLSELDNPFEFWTAKKTYIRRPHSQYVSYPKTSECPCGSGKKYQECCLKEDGVLQPHIKVFLNKQPQFGFLSATE